MKILQIAFIGVAKWVQGKTKIPGQNFYGTKAPPDKSLRCFFTKNNDLDF